MIPRKYWAKILAFISLFLLIPAIGLTDSSVTYQSALGKFYDECSRIIYENYILQGYEAVYWGKPENLTGYDLSVLYNESVINRINALNQRTENRTFEIGEKTEAQIREQIKRFKNNRENPPPSIPDISKIAVAEIVVNEVSPAEDDNFSLKLSLRITTLGNAAQPFVVTQTYNVRDKDIRNYIVKKQFSPLITFSLIGLTLVVIIALASIPKLTRY